MANDPDLEMHAYIDEVIIGDRTSDAAEDSAGAAWAAYERGEFTVPAWFSAKYRQRGSKAASAPTADPAASASSDGQVNPVNKLLVIALILALACLLVALLMIATLRSG